MIPGISKKRPSFLWTKILENLSQAEENGPKIATTITIKIFCVNY